MNASLSSAGTISPSSRKGGWRDRGFGDRLESLLRETISNRLTEIALYQIKVSNAPAVVYRAALSAPEADAPTSVIIKVIAPEWEGDLLGPDREANFYTAIHPGLGFPGPAIHFAGCDPKSGARVVIMEDMLSSRFPARTHKWTMPEARCFVRTYAHLHVETTNADRPHRAWLFHIDPAHYADGLVLQMAEELAAAGAWTELEGLENLLHRVLSLASEMAQLDSCVLHNDVFPPNIALPADLTDEAALVDWDMVGYGLPEMDLAFMFIQPFRSSAQLERESVLAAYWGERFRLEGSIPGEEERSQRQFFADALWGLYLIPIAHRSVFAPFPPGSDPDRYWDAMRTVLHGWLNQLAAV